MVALIVSVLLFSGCTKKQKPKVDVISFRIYDMPYWHDVLFAKDSATLIFQLDTGRVFKRYKSSIKQPQTFIVSQTALQDLSIFIDESCSSYFNKNKANSLYSEIGIFTNKGSRWCVYVWENDILLNYYERMLQYMKASEYKDDLGEIIGVVDFYIQNLRKIKQTDKDSWYDH